MLLVSAALLASGCGNEPSAEQRGSITVQLPPARPYKPGAAKPGFSNMLVGTAAAKT